MNWTPSAKYQVGDTISVIVKLCACGQEHESLICPKRRWWNFWRHYVSQMHPATRRIMSAG